MIKDPYFYFTRFLCLLLFSKFCGLEYDNCLRKSRYLGTLCHKVIQFMRNYIMTIIYSKNNSDAIPCDAGSDQENNSYKKESKQMKKKKKNKQIKTFVHH